MKIVAIILTCTLLGFMGWLVLDARSEARGARNQMEMLRREHDGDAATATPRSAPNIAEQGLIADREQQLLQDMQRSQGNAGNIPPPVGRPATPPSPGYGAAGTPAGSIPGTISLPPGMNPADLTPPPPATPRQRMIASAPVLAKVTEYQKEFGFVVINAGAKRKLEKDMTFAIRRGSAIIGRIKVTEVSEEGSVADLPVDTVPSGVTIEVGDEVIQDMPPEA
ncbi:hypothetical protein DES53_103271 [Roseimicrobium gellanilyticum]|uniref:Uncharacterized protein n=1 Tax=Roseimicrobium gellanilyticum TaxID=748857 RepID=A0A366HQS1_9BACT|nr:hypothetical protein [Roseimicrobium gellanilyticum]RBP45273.1 hypothetical protein DES53_103271 [Roseimicrobium gellanilyticum]